MSTATDVKESEVREPVQVQDPRYALPSAQPTQVGRLFDDVLLETSGLQRRRRTLSAVLSFVVQCLLLGVLLIVPLMFTDVLPQGQLLTYLMAPPPPPPPPAASEAAAKVIRKAESDLLNGRLRAPTKIPQNVEMIREEEAPPDLSGGGVPGGVPGGIPGGQLGGVIGGILSSTPSASVPKLSLPSPPKRVRVSQGVTEGRLVLKIEPKYPPLAQAARIQGQVILTAIISRDGEIQNLVLLSGHPMLVPAAIEAVKRWRFRPYLLNGEPVEVETTITVNFQLSQ